MPRTIYLSQYQSSNTNILATFDEDFNLATTTIPGGKITGSNLTTWREERVTMGWDTLRDTTSARIGWNHEKNGIATYSLQLSDDFNVTAGEALTFSLANTADEPLDFTITLIDKSENQASLPLSHIALLPQVLKYRMFKPPLGVSFQHETIFTTYVFPLADFVSSNDGLNLETVYEVRFNFDRTAMGEILIDDVGFINHY